MGSFSLYLAKERNDAQRQGHQCLMDEASCPYHGIVGPGGSLQTACTRTRKVNEDSPECDSSLQVLSGLKQWLALALTVNSKAERMQLSDKSYLKRKGRRRGDVHAAMSEEPAVPDPASFPSPKGTEIHSC